MEDTYLQYVQEQMVKWREYAMLFKLNSDVVSPVAVNKALAEYQTINLTLIGEENRVKHQHAKFMLSYNTFWDECYLKARQELNPTSLAGNKWASGKEIEAYARHKNQKDYEKWEEQRLELESKLALLRRVTDAWKSHYNILITLSTNMRSEMKGLNIEDHANNSVQKASRKPVS